MNCKKCGKLLDQDSRFCPECGAVVNGKGAPKIKKKTWLCILCLLVTVGTVMAYQWLAPKDTDTAPNPEYLAILDRYGYEDFSVYNDYQQTADFIMPEHSEEMLHKVEYLCKDDRVTACTWYFFATHDRTVEEMKEILEETEEEGSPDAYAVFEGYYVIIMPMENGYTNQNISLNELEAIYAAEGIIQR